jgi:hypothetical protein
VHPCAWYGVVLLAERQYRRHAMSQYNTNIQRIEHGPQTGISSHNLCPSKQTPPHFVTRAPSAKRSRNASPDRLSDVLPDSGLSFSNSPTDGPCRARAWRADAWSLALPHIRAASLFGTQPQSQLTSHNYQDLLFFSFDNCCCFFLRIIRYHHRIAHLDLL